MSNKAKSWAGVSGNPTPGRQVQLEEMVSQLANAYEMGKYQLPPEELFTQLKEYAGSEDLDWIMSLLNFEGSGIFTGDVSLERAYAIKQSEHAWRHSPLYQWSVWAWTNWGTGESVKVIPVDEGAREAFDEFWTADRNAAILGQDNIHAFSEWLLVTGDRYLVHFADTSDGKDTVKNITPDQFPDPPITDPNDNSMPLFYKRKWRGKDNVEKVLYYPDWVAFFNYPARLDQEGLLPPDAKRTDKDRAEMVTIDGKTRGTVSVIQHVAHNRKDENDLRGWPLGTISGPYQEAHKKFMQDRLTVAAGKAMYVRRKTVAAGSRGLASIKSTLESSLAQAGATWTDTNPPAPPASTELDDKAITTADLPMTTGASDAAADNKMFSWMALLGDGVFPTTAGLDTSRFATALTMDKNQAMLWSRYKSFIAQQFKDMVRIVLLFSEKYSSAKYADKNASVTIDTLSIVDFPPVVTAVSEMFDRALTPLVTAGIMPMDVAKSIAAQVWLLVLQALGIEDAGDLATPEAFGVGVEGEPAQEPEMAGANQALGLAQESAFRELLAKQSAAGVYAMNAIGAAAEKLGEGVE